MTENTVELEIPILLPGIEDQADACLVRLESSLQTHKGILRSHLERNKSPVDLCIHYDPDLLSLADVKRLAERSGAKIINRYHHDLLPLDGMDCSDCALVIEHSLGRMEGVLAVDVNYAAEKMRVEYDGHKINQSTIKKRIASLGYRVPSHGMARRFEENQELITSLLAGLCLLVGWVGETFLSEPVLVANGFYAAAYLLGGWEAARHAWVALCEWQFDTDLLMVVAALGAASLGHPAEGALLLFLFSLGHALEGRALDRARAAVRSLADLAPKTALVRRDDQVKEVGVEAILLDEVVLVRPGVRLPVDGEVIKGQSVVNQAPVTGESVPVEKMPGSPVFAGTVNGAGALEVRVTRLARDSTLARVMKMVEEAETQKSPTQQVTERFMRYFVPAILVLDLLVIFIPPLFGVPFQVSFLRAMTLLVAASPCALALGTPATVLSGIAQAARRGVLVKGGAYLENLGLLKVVAFDKTGTLTFGRPEVTDLVVVDNQGSLTTPIQPGQVTLDSHQETVLAFAAAVEARSAHPISEAVERAADWLKIPLPEIESVTALTGRGVLGVIDGQEVLVGSRVLLSESRIALDSQAIEALDAFESGGKTAILVAIDGELRGILAIADQLRPGAAPAIAALKKLGIMKTILLSGDNQGATRAIAQQAGVDEVMAELLPQDKLEAIRKLLKKYQQVGMVGDGVNDAPALANATVGIAMGGAGTDVALETADVALMGDDLERLPFAFGLGRQTRRVIIQNLVIAMSVIVFLVVAALTGWVGIGLAVVFHEGSTILVVLNALRLLNYR